MLTGRTVRICAPKTKTVLATKLIKHPRCSKLRKKKFLAHAASGERELGKLVLIKACAPHSKRKR